MPPQKYCSLCGLPQYRGLSFEAVFVCSFCEKLLLGLPVAGDLYLCCLEKLKEGLCAS